MNDELLERLVAITELLRGDCLWLQLLAENLFWASCEGFIQCSVLGAFNLQNQRYIADREREVRWDNDKIKPDLLLFQRCAYAAWQRSGRAPLDY